MGKQKAPEVQQVAPPPSPQQTAAAQVEAARGIFDLQLEKAPEFNQAEVERLQTIGPATAQSIADSQSLFLQQVKDDVPQFFDVLEKLGSEASGRLDNIGQLPRDVANQALEASRSEQALRGISGSPLGVAGTAGQLAALAQNQRGQDLALASGFLNSPFAPNVPLPGSPVVSGLSQGVTQLQAPSFGDINAANSLQQQSAFSNRALQLSNAQLQGGSGGGFGALAGGILGAGAGTFAGSPTLGATVGAGLGGLF